ncbi:hypothetical protein [Aquabacterium sp.]|uniref:hypothetical protein n=1 Tax=Aquabacterium sp. TaxID=1872578 RepID=UPI002BC568E6|nr:hypothetical protein [Aquabacterium sp.]HSW07135.1 hypothetical protein [Aquabacterium sp.]
MRTLRFASALPLSVLLTAVQAPAIAAPPTDSATQAGSRGGPPNGPPPGPPPEAITACTGKTAGVKVSFKGRGGETMSGTCQLQGSTLAARPDGPPGGASAPMGRPPVSR